MSTQIAGVVANTQQYWVLKEVQVQLSQREAHLASLGKLSRLLNSSLDLEHICQVFSDHVRQFVAFDRLSISVD